MAISPDHPLAKKAARANPSSPRSCRRVPPHGHVVAALETAEKKGMDTGIRVVHPFDPSWTLPVYVANFVLMDYGTGAIFGCPSGRPARPRFRPQVRPAGGSGRDAGGRRCRHLQITEEAYVGDGVMINSRFLDGLKPEAAFEGGVATRLEGRSRSAIARRASAR
jgi:leucyl-tRNA synthetase